MTKQGKSSAMSESTLFTSSFHTFYSRPVQPCHMMPIKRFCRTMLKQLLERDCQQPNPMMHTSSKRLHQMSLSPSGRSVDSPRMAAASRADSSSAGTCGSGGNMLLSAVSTAAAAPSCCLYHVQVSIASSPLRKCKQVCHMAVL